MADATSGLTPLGGIRTGSRTGQRPPNLPVTKKLASLPKIALFYALWYPAQWLGSLAALFGFGEYGKLAGHMRWAARASRQGVTLRYKRVTR